MLTLKYKIDSKYFDPYNDFILYSVLTRIRSTEYQKIR